MSFSSQGVCVNDVDQLTNSVFAVSDNKCGLTPSSRNQFVTNHKHSVIAAWQIPLDHDVFTVTQSNVVGRFKFSTGFDIDGNTLSLIAILRFNHHGKTNFLGNCPSVVHIFHRTSFRNRQASHPEQLFGQLFVLRNRFGNGAAGISFGGLNASLFASPTELHQAAFCQTDKGNISVQACIHNGCCGWAQAQIFINFAQGGNGFGERKIGVVQCSLQQLLGIANGQASHLLHRVLHHHLVQAFFRCGRGAAKGHRATRFNLQRKRGFF